MHTPNNVRDKLSNAGSASGVLRVFGSVCIVIGFVAAAYCLITAFTAKNVEDTRVLYILAAVGALVSAIFYWAICTAIAALVDGMLYGLSMLEENARNTQGNSGAAYTPTGMPWMPIAPATATATQPSSQEGDTARVCPRCGTEYVKGQERCSQCNALLPKYM